MMATPPIDYHKIAKDNGAIHSVHESEMPDYSQVPAFIQQGVDMSKVRQVVTEPQNTADRNSTAGVGGDDPYKVKVYAPDLYGPPILNHELTHTFQDTRNKSLPDPSAPMQRSGRAAYDYGGIKGLQAARLQGKTIANFNAEQQADMVKDYKWYHDQYLKKAATGKITPADEKGMYDLQQAYHPFIQQLAGMPGTGENLKRNPLLELLGIQKPVPLNAQPQPPGLPPYNTPGLGVLPADPLMGGKSQATPVKNMTLAQVKQQAERVKQGKEQPAAQQPKEAINQWTNPEDQPPKIAYAFNKQWAKPGPYAAKLDPQSEQEFRKWAAQHPRDVGGMVGPAPNFPDLPDSGYDARGWFYAMKTGDPSGKQVKVATNFGTSMHGSDRFKTPYNGCFSNESMYALPNAPRWVGDKLMTADGKLVTDETPRKPGGVK
jgi:hypothetical protein